MVFFHSLFSFIDFDLHKLSEEEQQELRNYLTNCLFLGDLKVYSIDVECVATGYRHCDRDVAKIAIVNALCEVVYESYVKPEIEIISYLTPLTGITYLFLLPIIPRKENLDNAPSLKECLTEIRSILPHDCILVGQGINHGTPFTH